MEHGESCPAIVYCRDTWMEPICEDIVLTNKGNQNWSVADDIYEIAQHVQNMIYWLTELWTMARL